MLINNTCIQSVSLKSHRHKNTGSEATWTFFSGKTSHFCESFLGRKKKTKQKNGFLVSAHEHHKWLYRDEKEVKETTNQK